MALHWDEWSAEELQNTVKCMYDHMGYAVEVSHGRLEPGIDLVARKYIETLRGPELRESIGIQVTKGKADKSRAEQAITALSDKLLNLSYVVVVALKGSTEDFKYCIERVNAFRA